MLKLARIALTVGLFALILPTSSFASPSDPDWSANASIREPRSNPYGLSADDWIRSLHAGRTHALRYPIHFSGVLMPWKPLERFLDERSPNPIRLALQSAFRGFSGIRSADDLFAKIGLHRYPETKAEGSEDFPPVSHDVRMGVTLFKRGETEALSISCAACHTANLFGKKILGMTNRFPGSNEIFVQGKKVAKLVSPTAFQETLGATDEETEIYERFRIRVRSVGAKSPATIGLDTSLAQVALSLARRNPDPDATFSRPYEKNPRSERLTTFVADSKPAVWWNLKYKNRWLSDGSIISGNPIYTNLLWNEIGRGTDLEELGHWLKTNDRTIQELTTAAFGSEAPRYTDFFPAERIALDRAKNGEALFNRACAKCHGIYEKAWNLENAEAMPLIDRLATTRVKYREKTPVIDVGTDPNRWKGMESLARGLNPLRISNENGIRIQPQEGYVPPPLVGIWARYPYFHNNSVPSLCAVLTPAAKRPKTYWSGEAIDRERDFDSECVGYPLGERVPSHWTAKKEHLYDTSREGMSNIGHDVGIFIKEGVEIFTREEKYDLIEFLKTL